MISRAAIRHLIDDVDIEYRKCWRVLSALKEGPALDSPKDFLDFQPTLASALFRLDDMYRALAQEQKSLISKKNRLSNNWFQHRIRLLHHYQEALKEVTAIGRALGDAFAWIFYQNEREYLKKHFEQQRQPHTPSGVGGRGELEFIRRIKAFQGQLTLYHGTTNFLRIGDVSFINLKTRRVTAIGELKTEKIDSSQIRITVFLIWPKKSAKIFTVSDAPAEEDKLKANLPPKIQSRLNKQLENMITSVEPPKPNKQIKLYTNTHIKELKSVFSQLKKAQLVYEQAGEGLMLMGVRDNRATLSSRLLGKSKTNMPRLLHDVTKKALNLIDRSQVDNSTNVNSLIIGHIELGILPGMMPIFWWPVPVGLLHKMFFREVYIVTMYNPAHLIRSLRAELAPIWWTRSLCCLTQ